MILQASQLRGWPKERAELYGKPHLGARYTGKRSYELLQDRCCVCGRRAQSCHHVAHRSWGLVFELVTPNGTWSLRSPLFALCGSGTTGCHDGFHGGARYRPEWVWDEPEFEEAWWDGTLLCEHEPHDPALYGYGHWAITDTKTGRTVEITEG